MSNYTHTCIKPDCSNSYTDNDPDAYYCESCKQINKELAQEIEKKVASRKSNRKTAGFNEQVNNMQTIKGITYINLPR